MTNTISEKDIEIFCSYAQEDEAYFQRLELELQLLKRRGQIADWKGSSISQSQGRTKAVIPHLDLANIILLLVSADYIASEYSWGIEMMHCMEKHQAGKARVIPVILRPVDWRGTPFGMLCSIPKGGKPVTQWSNPDNALLDIVRGIQMVIKELTA